MKFIKNIMCMTLAFILFLGLSACGGDKTQTTPTQEVKQCLDDIKSGDSQRIVNMFDNYFLIKIKNDSKFNELLSSSSEKMRLVLKDITYKFNSETIKGDEAVVNVTLTGPDLNEIFDQLSLNIAKDIQSGELNINNFDIKKVNEKYDSELSNLIKNAKTTERTANIELEKDHGKWVIDDEDLCKLVLNIDLDDYDDKYDVFFNDLD